MNKTYVEFFYPGSFVSETSTRQVGGRLLPVDVPNTAYAYRFYDRVEAVIDGETLLDIKKTIAAQPILARL